MVTRLSVYEKEPLLYVRISACRKLLAYLQEEVYEHRHGGLKEHMRILEDCRHGRDDDVIHVFLCIFRVILGADFDSFCDGS